MPRLFIATFLSDQEQARFAALPADNEHLEPEWQRKPRWIKPNKLHITWFFLGSVEASLVDQITTTLQKLILQRSRGMANGEATFTLEFNKPEVWPSSFRPRLIAIANKPISREAASLSYSIRTALIPFFTEETEQERNQEFKPHLTLLRLDRRDENPTDKLDFNSLTPKVDPKSIRKLPDYLPVKVPIEQICLVESQVSGHYYKILETVKLLP